MRSRADSMQKTNPTDLFHDPLRFFTQLGIVGQRDFIEEFNWVYAALALVRFFCSSQKSTNG